LIKPRVPDTFDSSDPNKLEVFLFQCQMYLTVCSDDFPDDESKVTFVLSYLKGSLQDWFQSELNHAMTSRQLPDWFATYRTFLDKLQHLFGPRDPITDAMNSLESLKLRDSGKATRYTIDFNCYARKTGWNKQALARQFYKNLPDRLKDEIAHIGKPTALKTLQDLVATLDQHYWECQSEINRDKKASTSNSSSAPASTLLCPAGTDWSRLVPSGSNRIPIGTTQNPVGTAWNQSESSQNRLKPTSSDQYQVPE